MVSIRMIIKLGPKNELQTLGFRTYYNQITTFFQVLELVKFIPRAEIMVTLVVEC